MERMYPAPARITVLKPPSELCGHARASKLRKMFSMVQQLCFEFRSSGCSLAVTKPRSLDCMPDFCRSITTGQYCECLWLRQFCNLPYNSHGDAELRAWTTCLSLLAPSMGCQPPLSLSYRCLVQGHKQVACALSESDKWPTFVLSLFSRRLWSL